MNMKNAFVFTSLLACTLAQAHTWSPGQIARYQSGLMYSSAQRGEKAFKSSGAVLLPGRSKIPAELLIEEPGKFQLSLTSLPRSLFQEDSVNAHWTLYRHGRTCVIKTDLQTVTCPPPDFWSALELGGRPEQSVKSLVERGFINEADAAYSETDSRTYQAPEKDTQKVFPAIGTNAGKPVANLELRGSNLEMNASNEAFPIIQFDPTFLAPLTARFKSEGDIITIRASADLEVRRHHTRPKWILSERVDVINDKALLATFIRSEPAPLTKQAATPIPKAITDLSALRNTLSAEGQSFLRALLLVY